MNFINNSFWLTDESQIQFTPIAKRNKINPVKTCQNLMSLLWGVLLFLQNNKKVFKKII